MSAIGHLLSRNPNAQPHTLPTPLQKYVIVKSLVSQSKEDSVLYSLHTCRSCPNTPHMLHYDTSGTISLVKGGRPPRRQLVMGCASCMVTNARPNISLTNTNCTVHDKEETKRWKAKREEGKRQHHTATWMLPN